MTAAVAAPANQYFTQQPGRKTNFTAIQTGISNRFDCLLNCQTCCGAELSALQIAFIVLHCTNVLQLTFPTMLNIYAQSGAVVLIDQAVGSNYCTGASRALANWMQRPFRPCA